VSGHTWPLTIRVLYNPGKLTFPLADVAGAGWPFASIPNLKGILEDQTEAIIWADPHTHVTELTASLTLGQNLVLRSASVSPPSPSSTLNISQGISLP
jgi:hypothetical protein